MSNDTLQKVIDDHTIPLDVAEKYLTLFLGQANWQKAISKLWEVSGSKNKDIDQRKLFVKKSISCATLISYVDKANIPEVPENLLFWCSGWVQFNERDWFKMYQDLVKQDIEIIENRNKAIVIGVIDPIDISPLTRQAFNWLYNAASDHKCINDNNAEDLKIKFSNLVKAYGGAVVCNLFVNHKKNVDNVFNWNSGYFFEREIHKVYSIDQILKIKNTELQKANQNYVKKISSK
jgi:hypothetical protein